MATTREYTPLLNGGSNGSPWWVKAAYTFGVPTAMAAFLLWFVTSMIASEVKGLRDDLRSHIRDSAAQSQYLRAICLHSSQSDAQRADCELPR